MTDNPSTAHVTTGIPTGTTARWAASVAPGAPFTRATCWRPDCRAANGPYATVRIVRTLIGGAPALVVAPCHLAWPLRPWELAPEDRAHLFGGTA